MFLPACAATSHLPCISARPTRLSIHPLACKSFSSPAMPIDLNKLPHIRGESIPNLNEEPAHEEEQKDQVHLQVHIQGDQPIPNLHEEPTHEEEQEDQVHLQVHSQGGHPLPDLNEEPAHEQDEEDPVYLQVHLQGQPLLDLNEPTHDQGEINHCHEGQF